MKMTFDPPQIVSFGEAVIITDGVTFGFKVIEIELDKALSGFRHIALPVSGTVISQLTMSPFVSESVE